MQQVATNLKYYFDVVFTDGSTYTQNHHDQSHIDTKRSCFYDVLQALEQGKRIQTFLLSDGKNSYSVDLMDGHFEINDIPFFMHDSDIMFKEPFQIIFYRQHTQSVNPSFPYDGKIHVINKSHTVVYCIGWQTNDQQGKTVKQIMQIE